MKRTLPPLGALPAFEAAARHLSFTRAGAELAVTQAAISHHVKALEAHLGRALFRRRPRALLLTDEGQRFYHAVAEALERLEAAAREAGAAAGTTRLVVTLLPSFAARWLVPRLGHFYAAHPTVDLHVVATPTLLDLEQEGIDVAIRYGGGHYRGYSVEHLLDEEMFPVCSPRLRQGRKRLRSPADLPAHTILHEESDADWRAWLKAAGVAEAPRRATMFTDSSLMLQAAVAGQGVALGRSVLVRDELAAGRLVRPFPRVLPRWPSPRAYWVASPPARARRPEVAAFRAWLQAEARADREHDGRRRKLPPIR
jgi:LysR family glycine cleavage system transcriptional activator